MLCRPEPCNHRARAIEQRLELHRAEPAPVVRVVPQPPNLEITLESQPGRSRRNDRSDRPRLFGAIIPNDPIHTVASGKYRLLHSPSSALKIRVTDCK